MVPCVYMCIIYICIQNILIIMEILLGYVSLSCGNCGLNGILKGFHLTINNGENRTMFPVYLYRLENHWMISRNF